jgi:hypothetical protein
VVRSARFSSRGGTPASELTAALEQLADAADREPDWPAASWDALRRAGVLRWSVPRE